MSKYRSPFKQKCTMTTPFKKKGNWIAGYHTGEDWVCNDRTLVAVTDGTVTKVSSDGSYGNHLIYKTNDGKCVLMAHMRDKPKFKVGDTLKRGQTVGIMGNTGNSYGAHLHIEVENSTKWGYNKNLLKPSDYINFQQFTNYTVADARKIVVDVANGTTDKSQDVNGDGKVTVADARKIINDIAKGV